MCTSAGMNENTHVGTLHNKQNLEIMQVCSDRRMDKYIVVHAHNEIINLGQNE
jgi:hypothetical protein